MQSAFAWRGKTRAPTRDSLPIIISTIIHIAFFATAGLLSGRIAFMGSEQALIQNPICGFPKEIQNVRMTNTSALNATDLLTFNTEVLMGRQTMTKSMAYVRSCYKDDSKGVSAECSSFVKPQLWGINASALTNASCPFGGGACATSTAVRYDSGHLHSNEDLGINNPREDALSLRRVTSCAPILANKYATRWNDNLTEGHVKIANTSIKFYEFGTSTFMGCEAAVKSQITNLTTFCVSKYQKEYVKSPLRTVCKTWRRCGNITYTHESPAI
jgi:hypothetical protein